MENQNERAYSLGESRLGIDFDEKNVGEKWGLSDHLKHEVAHLMNKVDGMRGPNTPVEVDLSKAGELPDVAELLSDPSNKDRCIDEALRLLETASMYITKAHFTKD